MIFVRSCLFKIFRFSLYFCFSAVATEGGLQVARLCSTERLGEHREVALILVPHHHRRWRGLVSRSAVAVTGIARADGALSEAAEGGGRESGWTAKFQNLNEQRSTKSVIV